MDIKSEPDTGTGVDAVDPSPPSSSSCEFQLVFPRDPPLELQRAAEAVKDLFTEDDPGVGLWVNVLALNARAGAQGFPQGAGAPADVARLSLRQAILGTGMREALDRNQQPYMQLYHGSEAQWTATMNALCSPQMAWVRSIGGLPDIAELWLIRPQGANKDLQYFDYTPPFHI